MSLACLNAMNFAVIKTRRMTRLSNSIQIPLFQKTLNNISKPLNMTTDTLTMILHKKNLTFQCLESIPDKVSYLLKFDMNSCATDYIIEKRHTGSKLMFIYAILPAKVPKHKRKDIAVYTTLLNNNLSFGCWELNMEDGTLRFRISYLFDEESAFFEQIFLENLDQSIRYTDICIPGIFAVIYAEKDPYELFLQLTGHLDIRSN
jgi:hypothetical protein